MTASRVDTEIQDRLWIWFGRGGVGPATVLAVLVQDPDVGVMYRPLIAGSLSQANDQAELAQMAGADLGLEISLREYQLVSVVDLSPRWPDVDLHPCTVAREHVPTQRHPQSACPTEGGRP